MQCTLHASWSALTRWPVPHLLSSPAARGAWGRRCACVNEVRWVRRLSRACRAAAQRPQALPGPSALLRCFVRREGGGMGDGGAVRFMLYHGLEHTDPKECKFLLAAKLTSRRARAPARPACPAPRARAAALPAPPVPRARAAAHLPRSALRAPVGLPNPGCGRACSLGSSPKGTVVVGPSLWELRLLAAEVPPPRRVLCRPSCMRSTWPLRGCQGPALAFR